MPAHEPTSFARKAACPSRDVSRSSRLTPLGPSTALRSPEAEGITRPRAGPVDLLDSGGEMKAEFVLDTPVVRSFVADVEAAIAGAASPEAACEAIRPCFSELLADPDWLPDDYRADAPESGMGGGIGQWLLFRAGDGSLSLFSLVVPPVRDTPIHDHLAWGLVGLYRGSRTRRSTPETGRSSSPSAARSFRRLLRPDPAARRHPPRADDVSRRPRSRSTC